jgi:hypothetical protein
MRFLISIKTITKKIILPVLLIAFSHTGFTQLLPDTFKIVTTEKGIKQLSYPGNLPGTEILLESADFSDKLISCIEGKYILDSVNHRLDSGTTVKNSGSYLKIKRVSKTELVMSVLLDVEITDNKYPSSKTKFAFNKESDYYFAIQKGNLHTISKYWRIDYADQDMGFLQVEYWLRNDSSKVEFEKYHSKKKRKFKKAIEQQPDIAKKYIPVLANDTDGNWQIYFLFHDNYAMLNFRFRKMN